jgi:predicted nucleic acid-binding protein
VRFADANVFLRYLTRPVTPIDQQRFAACSALFARVQAGDEQITTADVILAEVFFVLTSPRQYGLTSADAAARLEPIVAVRGLRLQRKRVVLRALALLVSHPKLGFEDALVAATLQRSGMRLLSYDTDFDRLPKITREEP